ncbi:nucleotide exchange factor GrpE [Leifsonia sp. TF02-11]|uniref:nucleotide exchange factor GrpE n=1 Tax=Leifsonia sp. TF02-11 TaxID=2815212 RepID=UPI001AA1A4EC|nr:nucleotide exchange factor GrpE [Leifsonia sp. TF02-11]MBO1740955.1 nucleotide exchange factor GrpE [Leifsonia sp. TF02-11]
MNENPTDPVVESSSPPTEPIPVQPEVDERDAKITELEDRWRRSAADLDNARKRFAKESAMVRDGEQSRAAGVFLPVIDGLDDALVFANEVADPLTDGIRAIRDQAIAAMLRLGFPRIDATGVPFDPALHEAASVVPSEDVPPRTVVSIIRAGYGLPDRLLRPATVVVSSAEG